ncbi:hypothetical protein PsAD2_00507 [Pseudovibrio axinellae]|uniref:Uncharacterized protein n=1 Tax=Pseudovibrio axinellae TaxID=989403 RepID=A0A166AK34_9HYPH|nr:hypothetical protein [Pseudovibrio axinellae]KZL21218.1 hypothetical protein PsAD2_00507 [Pseudovibrio axinellae]SEQ92400.1 hypothetical protein SAMN05421798_105130 [Pseudovibrio axinellae]
MKKTIKADELDRSVLEFGLLVGLLIPAGDAPHEYKLSKEWLKDPVAQLRKQLTKLDQDLNTCLKNALHGLKTGEANAALDTANELSKWNPLLFPALGLGGHVGSLGEVAAIDWFSLISNGGDFPETIETWVHKIAGDPEMLRAWGAAVVSLASGKIEPPTGAGTPDDPYLYAVMEIGHLGTLYLSLAAKKETLGTFALVPGLVFDATPIELGDTQ